MKSQLKVAALALTLLTGKGIAGDYRAKNGEVDVFAAVLRSEVAANHWTDKDVVCISIQGKDPHRQLIAELRRRKLNVRSQAEWRRKLVCGFEVWLQAVAFDSGGHARAKFQSDDLREVNTGEVHVVTYLRGGEYSLNKVDGKWIVGSYVPEPKPK